MQRRLRRRADERVALALAEAARAVAEENTRRSNFLAHASRELGGSLDVEPRRATCSRWWCRSSSRGAGGAARRGRRGQRWWSAPRRAATRQRRPGWRSPTAVARCRRSPRCAWRIAGQGAGADRRGADRDPRAAAGHRRRGALGGLIAEARARRADWGSSTSWSSAPRSRSRTRASTAACRSRSTSGAARGAAAGVEPAQGRVPRDAVARAAQPARADPQRGRGRSAASRRTSRSSPGRPT